MDRFHMTLCPSYWCPKNNKMAASGVPNQLCGSWILFGLQTNKQTNVKANKFIIWDGLARTNPAQHVYKYNNR